MRFARWVFWLSGAYGVLALTPMYLLEGQLAESFPPPIEHPEYFYGFIGVALAWQVAFLIIGVDPVRYRPLMLPSILEKLSYGTAGLALFAQGRVPAMLVPTFVVDLTLGSLFAVAWWKCAAHRRK